jgi:ubiquinone/menaquinone biosynthesis C-methylase UbiE
LKPQNSPDLKQSKESVREEWSAVAEARRKWDDVSMVVGRPATEAIVEAARVKAGMNVLDLASGAGEPSLALAEAVGPEGRVTATDLVPELLSIAEKKARERGLRNMTFRQADAESLPFADRTFDAVTCRFGVMYFPDVRRALREVLRVLKPGGQGTFAALGPMEQSSQFRSTFGVFLKYARPPHPEPGALIPFRFAKAGALSAELQRADFKAVHEEYRTLPWLFPGPPDLTWDFIRETAAPFHSLFESFAPSEREKVIEEVLGEIGRHFDGQRVSFSTVIVLSRGRR